MKNLILINFLLVSLLVTSCNSKNVSYNYPKNKDEREREELGSIITGDASYFSLGGSNKKQESQINKYIWQAALEVIAFMPIASTDLNGGVIITDWYSDEKTPNERFKFNILISNSVLGANALSVKGYKQVKKNGNWLSSKFNKNLEQDLEQKILTRAREIKIANY